MKNLDVEIKSDNGLCPSCHKNKATEPHTCPYDEEVSNFKDKDLPSCICCDECAAECYWNT